MNRLFRRSLPILVAFAIPAFCRADDLTNQQLILCTSVSAMHCSEDGDCVVDMPWNLNIPQFLQLNLKEKTMSTTKPAKTDAALYSLSGDDFSFQWSDTTVAEPIDTSAPLCAVTLVVSLRLPSALITVVSVVVRSNDRPLAA